MGAIEEVYADLEADVAEETFREAVEAKIEQMGGLADEETAAMLVAHELRDNEVETVADVEAGMDEVKFVAKVVGVGDLRTFERDGEDEDAEGRVINVEAADETGAVRLAFWDEQAAAIDDGQLAVGEVIRVKGRPKEGYNGLEVSVDKAEPDDEVSIDVDPGEGSTIDALTMGQSDVTVTGEVLGTESVRTFDRDDGSEGRVANATIGDETGRVRVTMWDDKADLAEELSAGDVVEVVDGYVRERDGDLELHVGDRGAVETVEADVHFDPDADAIADLEIGESGDIAGVVRSTDPKRTFDRDDGSEGQVRNVRIQDDTDDIRVALWGDHADAEVQPGDEVFVSNVEVEEGWQDDREASANWASTLVPLAGELNVSGAEGGESAGGLAAFTGEGDAGEADGDESTADSEAAGGVAELAGDGETVEFTGTVVQTGEPVVLDDGERTVTVETEADLTLGEEVTVRGPLADGRLDAEDVF